MKALQLLEMETLENELRQRMGRGLTREESFHLSIATAYDREGSELPQSLVNHYKRPS